MGNEEVNIQDFESPGPQTSERGWVFPENVRKVNERTVVDENGNRLGEIHEFTLIAEKGAEHATLTLTLPGISEGAVVSRQGWHTWSESGEGVNQFRDVGMQSLSEATQGSERDKVATPGGGREALPVGVGESFGYVSFRRTVKDRGTESTFVGLVPGLRNLEDIRFRTDGEGNMLVTLDKDLESSTAAAPQEVSFKVFLSDESYGDALNGYSRELERLLTDVQPLQDEVMSFTWANYGKFVNIENVRAEVDAISGDPELSHEVTGLIIDDGWEKEVGNWNPNEKRFPDLKKAADLIREKGMQPGIWVAPFITDREAPVFKEHPDWIIKDAAGKPMEVSSQMVDPTGRFFLKRIRNTYGLDISIPEVREYLYGEIDKLSRAGFEVFKLDYLSAVFTGELRNKERTSVEYYRDFFRELREKVPGIKKIIGCGAPILESTGLFELTRYTGDSADATFGKFFDTLKDVFAGGRPDIMYSGAARTAFHRAIAFGRANGLMLDGVHLNDPDVKIDQALKDRLKLAFPVLKNLGVGNLTIGDSMARAGREGRRMWSEFIDAFRKGKKYLNPNREVR